MVKFYDYPKDTRVDSGVEMGSEVGIFYDPMISKLVIWAENREMSVQKMARALDQYSYQTLIISI